MSSPKTLLQMVGVNGGHALLSDSAIVVIDAQNEYVNGKVPLHGVDAALDQIARVLDVARSEGAPIIHVVHRGRAGGLFDPFSKSFQIHPKVAPAAGEKIVEKELPNAFARTSLQLALRATERRSLIVAGFMTHLCVSATVRAALDHSWRTTVVADAGATRDLPCPFGGDPIPAAEVHRGALAALADRFASIARVADFANEAYITA
jgi:nicotinamidase-related amidase